MVGSAAIKQVGRQTVNTHIFFLALADPTIYRHNLLWLCCVIIRL